MNVQAAITHCPRLIVGGGMITHDQILPSIYHLQRLGAVGPITICALNSAPLRESGRGPDVSRGVSGPDVSSRCPRSSEPPERMFPDLYREAIAALAAAEPGGGGRARPFPLPRDPRARLEHDQHVLTVKPLVLKYAEAKEIEELARPQGLLVGVEYHKRFDRRSLDARGLYRRGRFGQFRCGEAKLVEPYYYRHSNFQNWFTKENSDPFTYIGCHYVDLVYFITGLRPVEVSVRGVEGPFPNGKIGYLWSTGHVIWENGAILSVVNGLGYPDEGAGTQRSGPVHVLRRGRPRRPSSATTTSSAASATATSTASPAPPSVRQPRLFPARALARRRPQTGRLRLRFGRGHRRGGRSVNAAGAGLPSPTHSPNGSRPLDATSTAAASWPRRPTASSTSWWSRPRGCRSSTMVGRWPSTMSLPRPSARVDRGWTGR